MFYCSHFISGYTTTTTCEYIHVFKIYTYKAKSSELERIKANCVQIFPKKKSGLQSSNLASSFIKLSCFTAFISGYTTTLRVLHVFKIYTYKAKSSELERIKANCVQIFPKKKSGLQSSNLASSYQVIYCSHFISGYTTTTTCEYIHVFKIYTYKAKSSELERIKANCVQIFPKKKSGLQSSNLASSFINLSCFTAATSYQVTLISWVLKIYTYKAKSSELERIKANCVQIFPKKKSGLQSSNLASSFIKLSCFTAATSYQVTLLLLPASTYMYSKYTLTKQSPRN